MVKGIKICGVSDKETLEYILNHSNPPKFIGFITNYKKSKRYVKFDTLKKLTNTKRNNVSYVSVLVNPNDEILDKLKNLKIDYYQLYDVGPERTKFIKEKYNKKIISSILIQKKQDVENYKFYQEISDIILFDGKGYEKSIGFDHSFLENVPKDITKMVAGNLNVDSISNLKLKDYIIDLSGSLENQMGKKDLEKINTLLSKIKQYET
ncbi:phosphoribosylanthranilate isomerase [Candidatus Pelagibacter sp.]|nr:phosphoribosylanthranilate isomerase [Candidatus Pelagibacter sp.]